MLRPRNPIGALHIHSQNSFYDILAPLVNCIEPISLIYHSMQNFSIIVIFPDLNGGCATLDIHQGCVLCFSHSHCTTWRTLKIFRLRWCDALCYFFLDLNLVQSSTYTVSFFRVPLMSQFQHNYARTWDRHFLKTFYPCQNLCIRWLHLNDSPTFVTILLPYGVLLDGPIPNSRFQQFYFDFLNFSKNLLWLVLFLIDCSD